MLWPAVASSDHQRARVLAVVKAPRYARPPLRGAHGLDDGSAHARPDWLLSVDAQSPTPRCFYEAALSRATSSSVCPSRPGVREAPPVTSKPVAAFAHLRYSRAGTTRCAQHASGADYRCRSGVELLTRSRRASLLSLLYALCSGRRFGRRRKGMIRTEEQHSLRNGSHVRPYIFTCLLLQLDNPMAPFTRSWPSDARRRRVPERGPARIRTPVNSVSSRHIAKRSARDAGRGPRPRPSCLAGRRSPGSIGATPRFPAAATARLAMPPAPVAPGLSDGRFAARVPDGVSRRSCTPMAPGHGSSSPDPGCEIGTRRRARR